MSEQDGPSLADAATALVVGIGQAVIRPMRPAAGPATHRWGVGLGEAAASLPNLPGPVRAVGRRLNRFGSVAVSPRGIEYDGEEVPWSKVTEIRTRRLLGYLFTDAITKQVGRLPVWWLPGRGLVIGGLTRAALTALALAADLRLDRGVFTIYIPADVESKGFLRRGAMSPGIPTALLLADPAVRDFVESTAHAHGIPVLPADDDALEQSVRRAAVIREVIASIGSVIAPRPPATSQADTRSSA